MGQEITNYDEAFAKAATAYASAEPVMGGSFLSTRGGVLKLGDDVLPGNQLCGIILDSLHENNYYTEKFDAENPQAPRCYAFGRTAEEMAPHPSMQIDLSYFQPQHSQCTGCPMNEWGTADTGRGKACQNRRRLAIIPAGFYNPKPKSRDFDLDLVTDPKFIETADVAFLKLPVTSTKAYSKYINQLSEQHRRPPFGAITRIYLEPSEGNQYEIFFELVELVPDEFVPIVIARNETQVKQTIQGYKPPDDPDQRPKQGSIKGLRRR